MNTEAATALHILVVDDHRDIRESMRELLELCDYKVSLAETGPEALEKVRLDRPDVALIDIHIPGFDGLEVARRIRLLQHGHAISLVAFTGYSQPEDRRRAFGVGFDFYLVKPVNSDLLFKVIGECASIRKISSSSLISIELMSTELLAEIAADPKILKCLSWREFEKVLAGILERLDYEIELQQGTKDGGIDIFAIKRAGPFGPHRYLLQAKRWSKPVGVQPVRELMFLHSDHHVTKSCLATTSRFTEGALALAERYKWQLELRDYDRLLEWVSLCTPENILAPGRTM